MRPVESIPGIPIPGGIKENDEGDEFNLIYLIYRENFSQ
jgi:hypothetical protein